MKSQPPSYKTNPLPAIQRFYFYGVQGFCDEIIFTSIFDFFKKGDWSLKGHSSISSFFIYGLCSFFVERLYVWMYLKHGIGLRIRIPLYVCIAYIWEFSCGLLLRQFDACPWDYSHYDYNFKGLITLEYAPGWLVLSFLQDIMADYLLRVQILPSVDAPMKDDPDMGHQQNSLELEAATDTMHALTKPQQNNNLGKNGLKSRNKRK